MEYVAYQGDVFQIEFYYDKNGKSQSKDYALENLDKTEIKKFLKLLEMMGDLGKIRNKEKFRNEGDKVFTFKPQPHRFFCFFFEGRKIIITNAFKKKQQKLPKEEKVRALKCKEDYENRIKKETYYEKRD